MLNIDGWIIFLSPRRESEPPGEHHLSSSANYSNSADPTEPGPFQKYLFSGACYVQIGNCYKSIRMMLDNDENIEHSELLIKDLSAIWNGFLTQQPGPAHANFLNYLDQQTAPQWKELNALYKEIAAAGSTVTRDFLSSLNKIKADEVDLPQFFIQWASSCDAAYDKLVRSETFSRAMGQFINELLRSPDLFQTRGVGGDAERDL